MTEENKKLVLGLFIGVSLSLFLYFSFEYFATYYKFSIITFVLIFLAISLLYLVISYNFNSVIKKATGFDPSNKSDLKENSKTFLKAYLQKDFKKIEETQDEVLDQVGQQILKGIALNWLIKTFFSFTLAIAGILGTILLLQQNKLIEEQKVLMENQDILIANQNKLIENEIRPFVWSANASITVNNKNVQLLNQINNSVINSPAKINSAEYFYYLLHLNGQVDTFDYKIYTDDVWYPSDKSTYGYNTTGISNETVNKIPNDSKFYREVEINYSWLGAKENESTYYFKGKWQMNKNQFVWQIINTEGN